MTAHVLFVDDDEGNLVVCEAHCSQEFRVLTAKDAKRALELLRTEEVGVVVADQRMPGASGVELLEQVRDEYPDVVRILITAYSDLSAAIAAINRGQVRRYLKKPWQPEELKAELRDALDIYDMSRKLRALGTRLRETERVYSLGIVAAGVGHELRNPISWVHGNLHLIKTHVQAIERELPDAMLNAEAERHFQKIKDSLENAEGGVNRIFDIVRSIGMPLDADPQASELVELEEVLRLTLKLVSRELQDTAKVECELESQPRVRGNSTKVSQILLNLIVNAIQALADRPPEQNTVRITLMQDGRWAHLHVADNGRGITEADREKIFEPFFTTKSNGGTGLGLAICRRIARELGGTLDVGTDPELGGALFRLILPAYEEPLE